MPAGAAMQYSALTERVAGRGAGGWEIHREALLLREAGHDVIALTVGDPDQDPPAPLIEATIAALRAHRTGYARMIGAEPLREAIAARHRRRTGQPCTADNVTVVPGAQGGLYCALQCIAAAGDEVIVPEPVYATYEAVIGAAGATMVTVPPFPERGFHPDLDALAAAVTPKDARHLDQQPAQPDRRRLHRRRDRGDRRLMPEARPLARLRRGLRRPRLRPAACQRVVAARHADRTIVVSSLSKSHAVPGFRLRLDRRPAGTAGASLQPAPLHDLRQPRLHPGRRPRRLRERDLPEVEALRAEYRARATLLTKRLADAPNCQAVPPEGGMFVLLDIRPTGLSAYEFALALLEQEHVAILPCDGFGPSAAGHLRIALCASEERLSEAGDRIVRFAQRLAQRQ